MVDIAALIRGLPVSVLEPNQMAYIEGVTGLPRNGVPQESLVLLEPPAGQEVPYIDPFEALEKLMRGQGRSHENARTCAKLMVSRMRETLKQELWVNFLDTLEPESPDCLPVTELLSWLRKEPSLPEHGGGTSEPEGTSSSESASLGSLVEPEIISFIERAAQAAAVVPMFRGPDNWSEPWPLESLPALPSSKTMIEFMPGPPWGDIDSWQDWRQGNNPFLQWRESIRPLVLELEKRLGESVYQFADLDCDMDDDFVHRFLILHWCCTYKPASAFVRYLLRISGADTVEELKKALVDPASYRPKLFHAGSPFGQLEVIPCRFEYLPIGKPKTVVVVFSTLQARRTAQALLAQKIDRNAFIVAPKELFTKKWISEATCYCKYQGGFYLHENTLDRPMEILIRADELYVIADKQGSHDSCGLDLSHGAQDLLQLALELGIDAAYINIDGSRLWNPERCLDASGAVARVAAARAKRIAYTNQLEVLNLDNEYYSSALWTRGGMVPYDYVELPYPLLKRIAAWQEDFDLNERPYDEKGSASDEWWDQHELETIELAKALQAVITPTVVELWRLEGWTSIDQILGSKNENT